MDRPGWRERRDADFNFVLGESGLTWLPYVFDRLDTEYHDRASRRTLEKNLGGLPERVQRKITHDNVARLYNLS